jgi:hypothetical protein
MPRPLAGQPRSRGSITGRTKRTLSSPKKHRPARKLSQSPIQQYWVLFTRESLAEIRNEWNHTATPHIPLWCAQEQLCFTFVYCVINASHPSSSFAPHLAPAAMGTTRLERQPHPLKSYISFYRGVIFGVGLQHGEGQTLCPRESTTRKRISKSL